MISAMASTVGASTTQVSKAGTASPGSSSSATIYDPRDTNKDGKVSAMEQLQYDLKNGVKAKEVSGKAGQVASSYNATGKATTTGTTSLLNVLA
jgi:hypothetical protein